MWEVKEKRFKISIHGTSNPAILQLQGALNYHTVKDALILKGTSPVD